MNHHQAIQQLRDVLRRQHRALNTESSYVYWLNRYITSLKRLPQSLPSEKKAEHFLNELSKNRDISAATQHQAFNAIVFFYRHVLEKPLQNVDQLRVNRPVRLRHAPAIPVVRTLLLQVPDFAGYPTNLITRLLYGCGLRVTEPLNLRIKDVSIASGTLAIRDAKGGKDRVIALPNSLKPEIAQQLHVARSVWRGDQHNKIPLQIPDRLGRKYPEYQFAWAWAWLFPSQSPCRHPRTGQIVRFRMHEANVQRAIKLTRRKLGIQILPHELRHGYATHSLEFGANPRAIQKAMGHKSIETTMGYLHAESLSVPSPLDMVLRDHSLPGLLPASPLEDTSSAFAPAPAKSAATHST